MNPAGLVVAVAGIWVVCQVFGGNALVRLGIVKGDVVSQGRKLN